jgi:hypothetical protein
MEGPVKHDTLALYMRKQIKPDGYAVGEKHVWSVRTNVDDDEAMDVTDYLTIAD